MIHRFLLFDKDFNCRLDRFYPPSKGPGPLQSTNSSQSNSRQPLTSNDASKQSTKSYGNWQVLLPMDESEEQQQQQHLDTQLSSLSLADDKRVEHSQKLLLGATHSLRNMLLRLSPLVRNPQSAAKFVSGADASSLVEGYSFAFRTSGYRLVYFESFTGYRLLLLAGPGASAAAGSSVASVPTPYGPVNVDSCLKVLYAEVIAGYCLHYPLGSVVAGAEDDAFGRAGFLHRLDEYISWVEKLF